MKHTLITVAFALLASACTGSASRGGHMDLCEQVIDLAIEHRGETIELPALYDSLTSHYYVADSAEHSVLVGLLKQRGFKPVNWGRGNYEPLGPRIVSFTLQQDGITCTVSKIYYATIDDTLFSMSERIVCE